ncbi:hypothetical protein IWX64_002617 [Arthrobacter sp. CAN_A212]|uniref:hypothetical protein n=1 Tax=unclassified Arthrobacter TaxID=235627 RepID=UPI0018CBEDFF|nr:hypothetical protein [Arthrobacter sp. CAN_C5]MBP2217874.1 hypothetical protein [Arthrobacter sp. CAN_C5]
MNESPRPAPPAPGAPTPGSSAEKELARTRNYFRWFLLALLGAVLAGTLALPWKVIGLVLGLVALVLGIFALVRAIRDKLPALLRITTVVGLGATAFLVLGTGAQVALWPVTVEYEECMSTALTNAAQAKCQNDLMNLGGFLPGGS